MKLVDQKSWDLAEHFLQSEAATDDVKQSLAADIQQAVEDWFGYREMLREAATKFRDRRARLCVKADEIDFTIMRWAQRNQRVCCSNHPTGESILYGGRRQL